MKQATPNIRTIDHADHTDIERLFYVYSPDGNGGVTKSAVWAVVWCGLKQEKQAMTETLVPYEFEYAMSRLKDAIDYAFQTGEFEGVRLWAMNVEESHKAEVKDMQETIANLDEGAKLMHSLATGGEQSVLSRLDGVADIMDINRWMEELTQPVDPLSRLDNGVDAVDAQRWQDAPEYKEAQQVSDKFNFDTVTEQEF